MPTLHVASFAELDTATLYALLRLRVDVFVVEQRCPYPELDGRDTEPATRHVWLAEDGEPVAYLRLIAEPGARTRIGRVVVAPPARRRGLAARLMTAALAECGDREVVLAAQSHLKDFYQGCGFAVTGPEFLDDGIAHLPMRRSAQPPPRRSTAGRRPGR